MSNKLWTTQDIINNASNWSLSGDASLLKYLEHFSDELLTKASETNNNVNKLLDELTEASLSLDLVRNEFSSLHNNQFIESRVYEDDETVSEDNHELESVDDKTVEREKLESVKKAVLRGIEVVDKYFDKVEVPDSDSEDDSDFPSFVLKAKDPYVDRPLPHVIGTDEWHKKWHVGLLDSSSESEAENISEKFSDSDSEDDLPKDRSRMRSDEDMSKRLSMNQPVANSTLFDESVGGGNKFDSSDSEDYDNSVPAKAPISNNTFAQELAAKLGNVIEQNPQIVEPAVNTRPIRPQKLGDILFDEPPPIDYEDDDLFGASEGNDGLFSGSGRLFDDIDNKPSLEVSKSKSNLFIDEPDNIFSGSTTTVKPRSPKKSSKISGGLFDDDVSDDELFTDKPNISVSQKPLLQPYAKTILPYFDDQPPELDPVPAQKDVSTSKKPIGGVKLFEPQDLLDKLSKNKRTSSESLEVKQEEKVKQAAEIVIPTQEVSKPSEDNASTKTKQLSLFDDNDDLFQDDLFSNISTKKFSSNLFDDDLFFESPKPNLDESKQPEKLSDSISEQDLFAKAKPVQLEAQNVSKTSQALSNSPLFDNTPPKDNKNVRSLINVNLFDDTPPEDDDWDTKSDNLFDDNDQTLFDNAEGMTATVSLFDNEPPSLLSESSGIIRDGNATRVETDDSFNPYASSSRRFSSDIYNEQQSSDSFFVTKNKLSVDSHNVPTSIQEISDEQVNDSYVDITPSGHSNDLYSEATTTLDTEDKEKRLHDDLFGEPKSDLFDKADDLFGKPTQVIIKPEVTRAKPAIGKKPSSSVEKINEKKVDAKQEIATDNNAKKPSSTVEKIDEKKADASKVVTANSAKAQNKIVKSNKVSDDLFSSEKTSLFGESDSPENEIFGTSNLREVTLDEKPKEVITVKPKSGSPGKLKHNLNINVNALLPGAALPRRKDADPQKVSETETSPELNNRSATTSPTLNNHDDYKSPIPQLDKSTSFDSGFTEVLSSITKDRAKIAVKRRPSTRRGRQSSIRNSNSDFKLNLPPEENPTGLINEESKSPESPSDVFKEETNRGANRSQKSLSESPTDLFKEAIKEVDKSQTSQPSDFSNSKLNKEVNALIRDESTSKFEKLFGSDENDDFEYEKSVAETKTQSTQPKDKSSSPEFEDLFISDQKEKLDVNRTEAPTNIAVSTAASTPTSRGSFDDHQREEIREANIKPTNQIKSTVDKTSSSTFEDLFSDTLSTSQITSKSNLTFDDLFGSDESENIPELPKTRPTKSTEKSLSKLIQKDVDDLFDTNKTDDLFPKPVKSMPVKEIKRTSLFDDPLESDFSLFVDKMDRETKQEQNKKVVKQNLPQQSSETKKIDLFADSEEFDDIFSNTKLPSQSGVKKKSLFDDEDDDDIFGSTSRSHKVENKTSVKAKVSDRKTVKGTQIKKLENSAVVDDPLSSFYVDI